MNIAIIPDIIILFGGMFSFILFAAQLVLKNKTINNIIFSFLLFFIGIFQISNSYSLFYGTDKWFQVYNILFPIGIISFFFIGPLQYFYFMAIVKSEVKINCYFLLHLIPGLVSGITLALFSVNLAPVIIPVNEYRNYLINNYFIFKAVTLLSVLIFVIYCLMLLKYFVILYLQEHIKRKFVLKITIYFIIVLLCIVVLWLVHIFSGINSVKLIHMLLSIYIVAIFLLSNRYPQFMHIIKLEAQRDSYIRSQTSGLDVESILAKLSRIMIEQKLYINEDLTIGMLASQLEINTHQLSEILNLRIGKNFYNYINQLRIEEAKRMLTDEPGSNILSISIAVGYNTTSAFYNAFKKYMGISPSSYRKKNSISRK